MKRCGVWVFGLGLILSLAVGVAAEATPKFGYVDFQAALNGVNDGKRMKKKLEKDYDSKQRALKKIESKLEKQRAELEKDQMLLSAEALQKKQNAYREAFYDFSQKMTTYQGEMAQAEAQATAEILGKLRDVIGVIGKAEDYTMILESSQDVVLYAPPGTDITKSVIKAYNKKHR